MPGIFTLENLVSLLSLTVMEIVLGVDNVLFISIVSAKLPHNKQQKARVIGLSIAMGVRICLLLSITAIMHLKNEFQVFGLVFTPNAIIMLAGGLFLMYKSVTEIGEKIAGPHEKQLKEHVPSFRNAVFQIILLDIVFSFDSILTAIGIAKNVWIMIIAVIISVGIMMVGSGKLSAIINKYQGIKMLALAFLLMIGFLLVIDGLPNQWRIEIPKGYLYFAMFFAVGVEILNIRARRKNKGNSTSH